MLTFMVQAFDTLMAAVREGQCDLVTKADLRAELAGLERRMILFAFALVGALFAAIKLVP